MGLLENVKEVAAIAQKIDNIDLYRKILDLQAEIMEAAEEKRSLKAQIGELEAKLSFQSKLTYKSPLYYAEGDETPFCPRCWESSKKAVHLPPPFSSVAGPVWTCLECKAEIIDRTKAKPIMPRPKGQFF